MTRRKVSIFGATGSIGQNTLSLLAEQGGQDAYDVVALSGATNIDLLATQARQFGAHMAITADEARLDDLRAALAGSDVIAAAGAQALVDAAAEPVDWTMSAIVGSAGLAPGLRAAQNGGTLALANKESIVCAAGLFLETCRKSGTTLLPTDSEHSAIHQAMLGERQEEVERIILTASGGPFRDLTRAEMAGKTPEEARTHPNWDMGMRISIDSASMFNKALEIVEARYLFDLAPEQIEVIVHPQSIIHSMVGYRDGAIMAHMGPPDMRGAIGFALNAPERLPLPVERLDFASLGNLEFWPVDLERFPAIRLAHEVLEMGGLAGAVFNAAKEAALDRFIACEIGFLDMAATVEHVIGVLAKDASGAGAAYGLDDVMELDRTARQLAQSWTP